MDAPAWESAAVALRDRLSESGFAHSVRVAETAGALADVYGVDREVAMLAGLLHDWDRELESAELIESARSHDIPIGAVEQGSPYLLHALTGAADVREALPGLDERVYDAIARHTVGAREMTDTDMIVWVADMIEPGRRHAGLDDVREIVGIVELHTLFARAYEHSVSHIIASRRPLHPATIDVWNTHVARWHHE